MERINLKKLNKLKSKLKKILFRKLDSYFAKKSFSYLDEIGTEWVRNVDNSVIQVVNFSLNNAKDKVRIHVFIAIGDDKKSLIGGRFNGASMRQGDSFGGDKSWEITSENLIDNFLKDFKLFFKETLLPWFNAVSSINKFDLARSNVGIDSDFTIAFTKYIKANVPIVKRKELYGNEYLMDIKTSIQMIDTNFSTAMKELDFYSFEEDRTCFLRKRGEVYDVIIIETLNYGMSVGVYAFNWLEQLSIDGSGKFVKELAFMGNGGAVVTPSKYFTISAEAFAIGNEQQVETSCDNIKSLLSDSILPRLSQVNSKIDYIESVLPKYKSLLSIYFPNEK